MELIDVIPSNLRDRFRSIARHRHMSVEAIVQEALGHYADAQTEASTISKTLSSTTARQIVLPAYGDSGKKLDWNELKPLVDEADFQDDLRQLTMRKHAAD